MNSNSRILALINLFFFSCLFCTLAGASVVNAAPWSAGRIIDDYIFTNSNSMSVEDIQRFLDSKTPTCDTMGTKPYTSTMTRAQYAASRGVSTPFICLKNYSENGQRASQIIYNVAQQYKINPQALMVLLQKEQGLITDDWPWPVQYRSATGYGCPDTAPCDSQYYGLVNQLSWAAKMFRAIMDGSPTWYTPYILGNNYVRWSPNSSCGGANVYIENRATQALYNYTPYQPNQAALNAGYGSGDSCSAYGNRNFWLYFTDWFGSTVGPQYAFYDASNPPPTQLPNDVVGVYIRVINNSGKTWYRDGSVPAGEHPTRLAMFGYENNPYANQYDPNWLGTRNQIRMTENSVPDGGVASFTFTYRAPVSEIDNYFARFTVVIDGVKVFPYTGMSFTTSTPKPDMSYQVLRKDGFKDPLPASGGPQEVSYTIKNTGNIVWYNEVGNGLKAASLRMLTVAPFYRDSPFYDSSTWLSPNQIGMTEGKVAPGEIATFNFRLLPPSQQKSYDEDYGLVLDGVTPFPVNASLKNSFEVTDYAFQVSSINLPSALQPGERYRARVTLKNTGFTTWYSDAQQSVLSSTTRPTRLMNSWYSPYALADSADEAWLGTQSQIKMLSTSVNPGSEGIFEFYIQAPFSPQQTTLNLRFVIDGKYISPYTVSSVTTSTPRPIASYQHVGGTHPAPTPMMKGQVNTGQLIVKNTSNFTWYNEALKPAGMRGGSVRMVMSEPYYRASPFADSNNPNWLGTTSQISMETPQVKPGENAVFTYSWKAPQVTGIYIDRFSLLLDGQLLFPDIGMQVVSTVK